MFEIQGQLHSNSQKSDYSDTRQKDHTNQLKGDSWVISKKAKRNTSARRNGGHNIKWPGLNVSTFSIFQCLSTSTPHFYNYYCNVHTCELGSVHNMAGHVYTNHFNFKHIKSLPLL
jgi:type VI protein secretion system component Hcp